MRYLRSYTIVSFIVLILIGQTYSALGQAAPIATHVVINEADINPVGDDTKYPIDWVEIYNPTSSPVNISGWTIGATTGLQQIYTISSNTIIQSKQFMIFTYGPLWFPHAGAVIQLKNSDKTIIDQTPPLTDFQGGGGSWQRMVDGYDTGSSTDWVYKPATPGSSNGQLSTSTTVAPTTITFASDKTSYIFGDTVTMSGKVSKLINDPALGYPLSVNLVVSGPAGFQKTFTLYPNTNLQFSTSMTTGQILGFQEGNYTVSASYGSVVASSSFMLGSTPFIPPSQTAPITMSISTDQPIYTISQPITLNGTVSQVIPLTPVIYKVYEPNGTMIYQGNLYPDSQGHFTTYSPYQSHSSTSGIVINAITPIYGTYAITASYGTSSAKTSFTLLATSVSSVPIVLSTDKQVYGLGETVTIGGRINVQGLQNNGLTPSLQITQTYQTGVNRGVLPNALSTTAFVNVASDGTFSYKLSVPGSSSGLGSYRVTVTSAYGQAKADFVVVQDPSTYKAQSSSPLSIATDKTSYSVGDSITIYGKLEYPLSQAGSGGTSVNMVIVNSTGGFLLSYQNTAQQTAAVTSKSVPLTYYAYPDSNGIFQIKQTIQRIIFLPGMYTLKATYNSITASTSFSVYDPLATGSPGQVSPITASLD
ncbi:MAG: lamin tail domain-containing protein, partial [Thaumarchaeota archaeon]|nr:lamin tail domain-containing protein [Nitrososphaerota archaeon]